MKDFKASIDSRLFLDQPAKHKQEAYEKVIEMLKRLDYQTICINKNIKYSVVLTYDDKQINSQQINFVGKLNGDDGVTMFLVSEKQHKTNLNFFLDSLIVTD